MMWSSNGGSVEDALEPPGDEGRGKLREAAGSCSEAEIRGCPNRVTGTPEGVRRRAEHIGAAGPYAGE